MTFRGGARSGRARAAWQSLAVLAVLLLGWPCFGHKGSDAYWTLRAEGSRLSGRLDVALRDLNLVVPLDANADGALTWGEVRSRRDDVCALLAKHLRVDQGPDACPLVCGALKTVTHSDGAYAAVELTGTCPRDVTELQVQYSLLFDVDAQHRGLISLSGDSGGHWEAFTERQRVRQLVFTSVGAAEQTGVAFSQGLHHIAIGWDHLCFLFALLLPSVLQRKERRWEVRPALKPTLLDVTKVVTAFTVAHSVTLGLAAFELVHPNAHWVEVVIALSVAIAAFNNLVPFVPETRWSLAFSLGLMHGFGFVSAIADLGASGPRLWLSVLGFNLGVEAGQLAIVAAVVPVLWLVRTRALYLRVVLPLGSAVILGVALFWTSQRL